MAQSQKAEKKQSEAAEAATPEQIPKELKKITAADLEGRERGAEEAEALTKEFAEKYAPYLMADDALSHHLEQLYLMQREGMKPEFIRTVFCEDPGISETALDLLRCMALLGGEEFAMEFHRQSFTLSRARDALADHTAKGKYRQFDEIRGLAAEIEKMRERFDIQMEFLKREHDQAKAYADELIKNKEEAVKQQLQSMNSKFETEKELLLTKEDARNGALERDLSECTEKLGMARREADELKKSLDQEKEKNQDLTLKISALQKTKPPEESAAEESGSQKRFRGHFSKKEQPDQTEEVRKTRNAFLFQVLSDPDFKEEQLDIIMHAIGAGLNREALEKLCNPKLPAQNMQIFENFCLSEQLNFPGKEEAN